jgi:hypothetical protein
MLPEGEELVVLPDGKGHLFCVKITAGCGWLEVLNEKKK